MNPNMEWIAPLVAIMFLGCSGLIGLRMWLHRPRQPKDLGGPDAAQLLESVEQLAEQVHQLRGEMVDLHERIDFAERLLAKGE